MSVSLDYLEYPCPACATFSLLDSKVVSCVKCGYETRRVTLKVAYDYAAFVFRYGHQCKQYYQNLFEKGETPSGLGNIVEPHELHVVVSLPILSGVVGATSMFLVKAAINTLVNSYNDVNGTDYSVPEEDIKKLFTNFRVFTNNFADIDPKIRNAVFEEMFVAECKKSEFKKLSNLREKASSCSGPNRVELDNKAERKLNELMKKTFKVIANRAKPTNEELSLFWLKVIQ